MKTLMVMALLFSMNAQAGREAGGSKAIVCPDAPPGKQARLLDFYRGETEWGFQLAPVEGKDEAEQLVQLAERLKKFDSVRHFGIKQQAANGAARFREQMRFVENANFTLLNDSSEIGVPVGCHLELLINQKVNLRPDDKKYRVNAKVWAMLPAFDRAGAMVHELYYKEALDAGTDTADNAAYLTAILASAQFAQLSYWDYFKRLNSAGFPVHVALKLNYMENYPNGFTTNLSLKEFNEGSGEGEFEAQAAERGQFVFESRDPKQFRGFFTFPAGTEISFNLYSGEISQITGGDDISAADFATYIKVQGKDAKIAPRDGVKIREKTGEFERFTYKGEKPLLLKRVNGKPAKVFSGQTVRLSKTGLVEDLCSQFEDVESCESWNERHR